MGKQSSVDVVFMRVEDGDKIKIDGLCLDAVHTPGHTFVCPGHDYKGDSCSTIREERDFHPLLQVKSAREYAKIIDNFILPTPEMMEIVIPKDERISVAQKISKQQVKQVQHMKLFPDLEKIILYLLTLEKPLNGGNRYNSKFGSSSL
jgi:hypothetical protein